MLPTSQYTRIIGCTEFSKIDLKYFLYAEFLMAKAHLQSLNLNPRLNEYLNKLLELCIFEYITRINQEGAHEIHNCPLFYNLTYFISNFMYLPNEYMTSMT